MHTSKKLIHLEILVLSSLWVLFVPFTVHEHHNKLFGFSFRAFLSTTNCDSKTSLLHQIPSLSQDNAW